MKETIEVDPPMGLIRNKNLLHHAVLIAFLLILGAKTAQGGNCEDLHHLALQNTRITVATVVHAGQFTVLDSFLGDTVDHEFTTIEEVADVAIFLASQTSLALTGQSLLVSHGWVMD